MKFKKNNGWGCKDSASSIYKGTLEVIEERLRVEEERLESSKCRWRTGMKNLLLDPKI